MEIAGYQQKISAEGLTVLGSVVLDSFRKRIPTPNEKKSFSQIVYPKGILQQESKPGCFLLFFDDCSRSNSEQYYYGHFARVNLFPEAVILKTNFIPEDIVIRSEEESNFVIAGLIGKCQEVYWKDLWVTDYWFR